MLQKYAPQIKDVNDIRCAYVEGDENSLLPVGVDNFKNKNKKFLEICI